MGTVYHTGWTTANVYSTADMNLPLIQLDQVLCIHHNPIVQCNGEVRYNKTSGKLMWTAPLKVLFNDSSGKIVSNITPTTTTSITLADSEFAFLDLSTSDGATISASDVTAAAGTTQSTNIQGKLRCVLGYRSTSDDFYPVNLHPKIDPLISVNPTDTAVNNLFSLTLSASNAYLINADIVAKQSTAHRGFWTLRAGAYHDGASALLSGATWQADYSTASNASYLVTMEASGAVIKINVQADSTNVQWQAKVNYQEL